MLDLRGQVLGHFRIVDELGRGGMAIVYRAEQTTLGRSVALKVLPPNVSHWTDFTQRFHQEAVHAARLEHPHIVPIYETGEVEGIHFIAMQLVQGHTLKAVIERDGALAPERALHLLEQVAGALDYAHGRGVIHRDVKPSNVLVGEGDWAYLMDFGLARAGEGTGLTMAGTVLGTPAYMSPEQATGKAVDGRSDLYSLGIMLYEMLSGRVPFQAASSHAVLLAHLTEPVPPLPRLRWALPAGVEAVVQRALAKEAGARYESGRALVAALRQALGGQGATLYAVGGEDDLTRLTPAPLGRQGTATGPREATPGDGGVWQPYYTVQGGGGEAVSVRAVPGTKRRPWLYASLGGGVAVLALIITLALTLPGGDRTAQESPTATAEAGAATHVAVSSASASSSLAAGPSTEAAADNARSTPGTGDDAPKSLASTLAEGDRLLQAGSIREAQQQYEAALAIDERNSHALSRASMVYSLRGKRSQAIEAAERAVQTDQQDALAFAALSHAYDAVAIDAAGVEKARSAAERAVGLDANNSYARGALAMAKADQAVLAHDRSQLKEAMAEARRAVELSASEDKLLQALAQGCLGYVYSRAHAFNFSIDGATVEVAIEALQKATTLMPGVALFYSELGEVYTDERRYADAGVQLAEATRLDPELSYAHEASGWLHYRQDLFTMSLRSFARADELAQGDNGPRLGLAWTRYALQDYESAAQEFQAILSLDPQNPQAHYGLGRVYQAQGNREDAQAELLKVIELRPRQPESYTELGWLQFDGGAYDQARTQFEAALNIDGGDPDAYAGLGWIHRQNGEYAEALSSFQRAVSLDPKLAEGWKGLGWTNYDQDQYEEAVTDFSRGIALTQSDAGLFNGRGWAYYRLGEYDAAAQDFANATALDPTYANAYAGRGWVYLKQGDRAAAAAQFDLALQQDPNDQPALDGKKELGQE